MTTFRYFAYGSNMLRERLLARCGSAQVVGIGVAHGWDVVFVKPGRDGSGKATLLGSPNACACGPASALGVLFDIDERELVLLDRAEGAGYVRRTDIPVTHVAPGADTRCLEPEPVPTSGRGGESRAGSPVVTYVARPETLNHGLVPFDWYLALVLAGASQNGLPNGYVNVLRASASILDTALERPARRAALRALARAGIDDVAHVLG